MKTHRLGVARARCRRSCCDHLAPPAQAADHLLSGTIASAAGEKLGGVTVSAKAQGSDDHHQRLYRRAGQLLFPAAAGRQIQVWAQALAFETAKGEVDLAAAKRADLTLAPMTDFERQVRQLPGEMLMAALPEDDRRRRPHQAHLPQ